MPGEYWKYITFVLQTHQTNCMGNKVFLVYILVLESTLVRWAYMSRYNIWLLHAGYIWKQQKYQ